MTAVLLLLVAASLAGVVRSQGRYSIKGCSKLSDASCPFTHGNVIATTNSSLVHDCQRDCREREACSHFTLYKPGAAERTFCYLMAGCDFHIPCPDCTLGPKHPKVSPLCKPDCSVFLKKACGETNHFSVSKGKFNSTLLNITTNIKNPQDCQKLCSANANCQKFTLVSTFCFEYSSCGTPEDLSPCPECLTGPTYPPVSLCEKELLGAQSPGLVDEEAVLIGGISEDMHVVTAADIDDGVDSYVDNFIEDLPPRSHSVAEYLQDRIVLCGGIDGVRCQATPGIASSNDTDLVYNDCFQLNISSNEWSSTNRLYRGRKLASSVVIEENTMLVMGGSYRQKYLTDLYCSPERLYKEQCGEKCIKVVTDSIEAYNVTDQTWKEFRTKLPYPVEAACVLYDIDTIYLTGGINNQGKDLDSVYSFNLTTNNWTRLGHMYQNRAYHSCAIVRQSGKRGLLVVGGFSSSPTPPSQGVLDSTEFFEFKTQHWTTLWSSSLTQARYGASLATIGGIPTIFGGLGHNGNVLSSIERFVLGRWKQSEHVLNNGRAFFPAVTVPSYQLKKLQSTHTTTQFNIKPVEKLCSDLSESEKKNSIHFLNITGAPTHHRCDFTTRPQDKKIGWMVIQRRGQYNNSIDFFSRNKEAYEEGFGSPQFEYWIGLKTMHQLTSQGTYKLRIDMWDLDLKYSYAEYSSFKVGEPPYYKLALGSYSGNASDQMYGGSDFVFNNPPYGSWWYWTGNYPRSMLNGRNYKKVSGDMPYHGIWWEGANGHTNGEYSMYKAEMKIVSVDKDQGKVCTNGWFSVRGECYQFINTTLNWYTARQRCQNLGGDLAEPSTLPLAMELYANFVARLRSVPNTHQHFWNSFWVGFNDIPRDGVYVSARTGAEWRFQYWYGGYYNTISHESLGIGYWGSALAGVFNCQVHYLRSLCQLY